MFAVGTLAERLSVEEGFDPNVRIVGHEQPALDARFLDATELRQRCSIEPGKPAPTMITSNLSADMSALTGAQGNGPAGEGSPCDQGVSVLLPRFNRDSPDDSRCGPNIRTFPASPQGRRRAAETEISTPVECSASSVQ
jgi:hypothetical protein